MELVQTLLDYVLHVDVHLTRVVAIYGGWSYAVLFAIVFCETGLVVTPFLPGDSLLFAAGTLAAVGGLDLGWLLVLLIIAAVAGDTFNYTVGRRAGDRAFQSRGH